jgi:transketolase
MLQTDPTTAEDYILLRQRIRDAEPYRRAELLAETATDIRRTILTMVNTAGLGHIGGDLSVTDILVTLFAGVLSVDPNRPGWPERDRFILSKGHCAGALYATLARCGFFAPAELDSFMAPLSALNGHPNRTKVPGVETNTGPLGHGFPVAVGCALAARLRQSPSRTFVVLGDGEMQEGSNWEAAMTAAHYRLADLTAIVDRNRLQQGARTEETKRLEPLADKWRSFGFAVQELNGHDVGALRTVLKQVPPVAGKPTAIICHTVKGKGLPAAESNADWHHKNKLTDSELDAIRVAVGDF